MSKITRRQAAGMAAAGGFWLTGAAKALAAPVDESGFVRIGGIDQWIGVRGHSPAAPVALFLHGGPGEAMSPFAELFAPYEGAFTLARWDQRGAGKTYGRTGAKTPGMDPEQFVRDGIEVAEHLRRRLGARKIVLIGQSWGAALGPQIAKRRPDLFHAFVGCGQPVSLKQTILSQERFARAALAAQGDQAGLKALDDAARLPLTDPKRRFATRKWLFGPEDQRFLAREAAFTGPKPWPTTGEVADWIAGYTFTSKVLVPKILDRDVIDVVGLEFPVPFVVIQGRDDHITPTDVARDYVGRIAAPAKAFEEVRGGHFAVYTNPEGVLDVLTRRVLPLCRA